MPRPRSPTRQKAYELWVMHNGEISNVELSKILGVTANQVNKWKSTDKWTAQGIPKDTKQGDTNTKKRPTNTNTKQSNTNTKRKHTGSKKNDGVRTAYQVGSELTDGQRLFCYYYIDTRNAAQSYKRAYHCSYASAGVNSCRHMRDPKIRGYIEYLLDLQRQEIMVNPADIVRMYMKIAFANMNFFALVKDNRVHMADSDNIDGQVVAEIKETQAGVSIKLCDRMRALDWLSDYFMLNPLDQHKKEYDNKVIALKETEAKALDKAAEEDKPPDIQSYIDALQGKVAEAWDEETTD